ncbi:hypothetical protein [Zophobihabitans entericus]|uniref:Uncharacterized protein n=1 Tax=Zophobihabitans entericus TaxID=1635327 RepID=A0A6G9ICI4_9GAMM|nr:hypothetical protein [Zophobihabitans entericus]QIQ21941.1 hypothetical protein IPMB12_09770 [Zophobihabitans entericus]
MPKKLVTLICLSLLSQTSIAAVGNSTNTVLNTFTNCDHTFFQHLAQTQDEIKDAVGVITTEEIGYIAPDKENHTVQFKKPVTFNGLTLIGYQDIHVKTALLGDYYYWGFVIQENMDTVKQQLNTLQWQQYSSSAYVANTEILDTQADSPTWAPNPYVIDGIAPRAHTVEKSLSLEKQPDGTSILSCSLQGDVSETVLAMYRPDLKLKQLQFLQDIELTPEQNTTELLEENS